MGGTDIVIDRPVRHWNVQSYNDSSDGSDSEGGAGREMEEEVEEGVAAQDGRTGTHRGSTTLPEDDPRDREYDPLDYEAESDEEEGANEGVGGLENGLVGDRGNAAGLGTEADAHDRRGQRSRVFVLIPSRGWRHTGVYAGTVDSSLVYGRLSRAGALCFYDVPWDAAGRAIERRGGRRQHRPGSFAWRHDIRHLSDGAAAAQIRRELWELRGGE